jgi:hypothetical protein
MEYPGLLGFLMALCFRLSSYPLLTGLEMLRDT